MVCYVYASLIPHPKVIQGRNKLIVMTSILQPDSVSAAGHLGKRKETFEDSSGQHCTRMEQTLTVTARHVGSVHRVILKVPVIPMPVMNNPFKRMGYEYCWSIIK